MAVNDTIRLFGDSLYIEFGGTGNSGRVSTLQLDQGLTLTRNGLQLAGQYHNAGASFVIEDFANDHLASNGLQVLRGAVQHYAKRRRVTGAAKATVLWGIAPLAGMLLALALNAAVARQPGPLPATAALPAIPAQAAAALPPAPAQPPQADVATGLGNAVQAGRFSVQLSKGPAGTLYVFSDPNCPHCRNFERQLDALAKTYTVVVFPVSVIGGQASAARIAEMLCADPAARAAGWKQLISGGAVSNATQCAEGTHAVAANDKIFRVLGLPGTPSIVAADGRIMPTSMPLDAQSVDGWMRLAPQR